MRLAPSQHNASSIVGRRWAGDRDAKREPRTHTPLGFYFLFSLFAHSLLGFASSGCMFGEAQQQRAMVSLYINASSFLWCAFDSDSTRRNTNTCARLV